MLRKENDLEEGESLTLASLRHGWQPIPGRGLRQHHPGHYGSHYHGQPPPPTNHRIERRKKNHSHAERDPMQNPPITPPPHFPSPTHKKVGMSTLMDMVIVVGCYLQIKDVIHRKFIRTKKRLKDSIGSETKKKGGGGA